MGYHEQSQGLLTSGGSLANLSAMLIALRTKGNPDVGRTGLWNAQPVTIYASAEVHMSIPKAADILGIGREQVRLIETDDHLRMNVKALRAAIKKDQKRGFQPICVAGSAGTVATGAIDPLAAIADTAREFGLWFHVDGAYGALGAMDQRKRELFAGIERADSVSLDPHKWLVYTSRLRLSFCCGILPPRTRPLPIARLTISRCMSSWAMSRLPIGITVSNYLAVPSAEDLAHPPLFWNAANC